MTDQYGRHVDVPVTRPVNEATPPAADHAEINHDAIKQSRVNASLAPIAAMGGEWSNVAAAVKNAFAHMFNYDPDAEAAHFADSGKRAEERQVTDDQARQNYEAQVAGRPLPFPDAPTATSAARLTEVRPVPRGGTVAKEMGAGELPLGVQLASGRAVETVFVAPSVAPADANAAGRTADEQRLAADERAARAAPVEVAAHTGETQAQVDQRVAEQNRFGSAPGAGETQAAADQRARQAALDAQAQAQAQRQAERGA
jgi:hypothetical protein